ncbi:MAG: hypothetical protein FE835_18645 [Gammaproteobacteria bacterium]|nr:hypothetical protein [Gammaproteobacteria bacterium]
MKTKTKFFTILLAVILQYASVSAVFGFGGVVTDPGSYTHMIDQLREAQNLLKETIRQTDALVGMKDQLTRYQKDLERSFRQSDKFGLDFEAILRDITAGETADYVGRRRVVVDGVEEIDTNLDGMSVGLLTQDFDWMDGRHTQSEIQEIYKKAIREARVQRIAVKNRMEELGDIEGQIGMTRNLKESAAHRNRLLFNIEKNTAAMIGLLAKQQELEALSQYTGYSARMKKIFKRARAKRSGKKYTNTPADRIRARGGIPTAELTPFQKRCMMPWGTLIEHCE